jgi:hypothetical protein
MVRVLIGSVLGGIAQWIVGFLFWGTPLARLAFSVAPDAQNADIQAALARNLTALGKGTYQVPWPDSAQGTVLLGKGPVAMIHFNPGGFPTMETSALVGGLALSVVSMLLVAFAMLGIAARVPDFASRFRIVAGMGVATALYFIVGQPVYNFYMPFGYWIYLAVSLIVGFLAGGFVLTRWFLPRAVPAV